jgi:CheY-like chemotaxis protein
MNEEIKTIEILIVEDNPGDVRLIQEAFKDSIVPSRFHIVNDGEQALMFLYKQNTHSSAVRPDIIFLDLNLPKMNGMEVLEKIKSDHSLKSIPVVILTTSNSDEHVSRSYLLNANCYVTKPVDFDHFLSVVKTIESFWFKVAKLPASA